MGNRTLLRYASLTINLLLTNISHLFGHRFWLCGDDADEKRSTFCFCYGDAIFLLLTRQRHCHVPHSHGH